MPRSEQPLELRLRALGDPEDARFLAGYFKTGPGEYGEGDRFLGVRVPVLRKLAREHEALPLASCRALLRSPWHEARLLALLILVRKWERGDSATRERVHRLYLSNTDRVNNWDLVDLSAPVLVGKHLQARDRTLLVELARSDSPWERRMAILATSAYLRAGELDETLRIAELLIADRHDLVHKGVGWMLREAAKRDRERVEAFLAPRYRAMPRTMLRYATERFPETLRRRYLKGEA